MNCQICNNPSTSKYCNKCQHIRSVYVIHKLSEKISLNEKFNTNTLKIKNLENIEKYDLQLLLENKILNKDKLANYTWTNIENINEYLEKHDTTGHKITIKEETKKEDQQISTDEVILILEKNYNIIDKFNEENLSKKLKIDINQTKKIIQKLLDEKFIKKTLFGEYKLNIHKIIKYKEKNNIKEEKIKRLNNLKQTPNNTKKTDKNSPNKKIKKTTYNKDKIKKSKKYSQKEKIDETQLTQEEKIIPLIRKYINNNLIILPRNVKETDLTLNILYNEFKEYSSSDISKLEFEKYFHRTINTYPHIRHKKHEKTIRYNIKSRKTPQIIINNLQENTQKFTYTDTSEVNIKENTLKLERDIKINEIPQLYCLLIYTQENIIDYTYQKKEDNIHIEITYDLNNENPDLWIKFLKSYNI